MRLLVGVVVPVLATRALLREPGVESRRKQPVRPLLALCGTHREMVGVLVLGVVVVAPHPAPLHLMRPDDLGELLPQLHVLELAAFALPPLLLPARQPLGHTFHQVFRVENVAHAPTLPFPPNPLYAPHSPADAHPS